MSASYRQVVVPALVYGVLAAVVGWLPGQAVAQDALIYSFENDADGFAPNGGLFPVEQDTIGATDGVHSLKIFVPSGATFVGAVTNALDPAIGNPGSLGTGIDHVSFDLTITDIFGPEPPAASGFAVVGVTVFASTQDGTTTGVPVQFRHEFHIDGLDVGTHPVRIDLLDAHPYGPLFENDNYSFNEVFGGLDTMIPTGFQFFFNKTGSASNHPLTVYIDNVQVGLTPAAVEGDYNGNGTVDAADYTVWRDNLGLLDVATVAEGDGDGDGDVTQLDYDFWKTRFGNGSGGGSLSANGVPEPTTGLLLSMAACITGIMMRGGWGRR
jgi:hypothetical protein